MQPLGQNVDTPKRVQLPRSSTRLQLGDVYCKVIDEIVPEPFGGCLFHGKIYKPGAVLEGLPRPTVVIECAGPQGAWQRGKHRPYLYILWRFDFQKWEWVEIARAIDLGAAWTSTLREPAMRALNPRPELVDLVQRSRTLASEILEIVDGKLRKEIPEVRATALHSIYESVAGRIAECA